MRPFLEQSTLADLSRLVTERMGLLFPPTQWGTLERAFCRAAEELGFANPEECARWFTSAPSSRELIESMAAYLTIGETYFLREKQGFEILERDILPEIIRRRAAGEKRLRFWSAGCATGEEPYCLAILLHRMGALLQDWEISILATDINPHALHKAREGIYSDWSFRGTPAWFKENYFTPLERGRFELTPSIRKMVRFAYFNLMEDPYPALLTATDAIDVIFCRNVLMYFPPNLAERTVEGFRHSLVAEGWLVVSSCELSMTSYHGFSPVNYPDATLYQKQGSGSKYRCSTTAVPALSKTMSITASLAVDQHQSRSVPLLSNPEPPVSYGQPPAPYEEALTRYRLGDYREATEKLLSHLTLNPVDPQALALLCRIRANEGNLSEALLLSEQAINHDKLNAGLHYLRAMILQEQGSTEETARSLRRALYLDQDLVLAHFSMGNLALQQGKSRESRRYFDHALTILERYQPDETLPESEGMPAGQLTEIIRTMTVGSQHGVLHE